MDPEDLRDPLQRANIHRQRAIETGDPIEHAIADRILYREKNRDSDRALIAKAKARLTSLGITTSDED